MAESARSLPSIEYPAKPAAAVATPTPKTVPMSIDLFMFESLELLDSTDQKQDDQHYDYDTDGAARRVGGSADRRRMLERAYAAVLDQDAVTDVQATNAVLCERLAVAVTEPHADRVRIVVVAIVRFIDFSADHRAAYRAGNRRDVVGSTFAHLMADGRADYTTDDGAEERTVVAFAAAFDRFDDADGLIRCRAYVARVIAAVAWFGARAAACEGGDGEQGDE